MVGQTARVPTPERRIISFRRLAWRVARVSCEGAEWRLPKCVWLYGPHRPDEPAGWHESAVPAGGQDVVAEEGKKRRPNCRAATRNHQEGGGSTSASDAAPHEIGNVAVRRRPHLLGTSPAHGPAACVRTAGPSGWRNRSSRGHDAVRFLVARGTVRSDTL
jgi:hypothetical protein